MKAVVYDRYGSPDVLELRELPEPEVGRDQVLLRVHAASINAADWHLLTAHDFLVRTFQGWLKPKRRVLGLNFAGTVDAVGDRVTRFAVGDRVFGSSMEAGGLAELAAVSEDHMVHVPDGVGFEEAAAVPTAAYTALQALRDHGHVRSGARVLVLGASGGVGCFAVQLAKHLGAEVTGATRGDRVEFVRELGCDRVVDYALEPPGASGERFDVVVDTGSSLQLSECRRMLTPDGHYVIVGGPLGRTLRASAFGGKQVTSFTAQTNLPDLEQLAGLLGSGSLRAPIDRTFPLAETADAFRYLEDGRVRGKVVVRVRD